MKRSLAIAMLLGLSTAASADGWATLAGQNAAGLRIEVSPSREWHEVSPGLSQYLFHVTVSRGVGKRIEQTYPDQPCTFTYGPARERTEFACDAGAASPLSGTIYRIERNPDPEDCSYRDRYVCTKGCTPAAPRTMLHAHWECGEGE